MVEPVGEGEPVIDAQKGQQEDNDSNHGQARREASNQATDQRQRKKENSVYYRRNPENLFGDMHHRTPSGPIESLKHKQAGGFDQSSGNSPAQANQKQEPGRAGWKREGRFVFLITAH